MPKLKDVCHSIRSKNAGPFWISIDITFNNEDAFARYAASAHLSSAAIAMLYGVEETSVKHFLVPTLKVLKISYPRRVPQGGYLERDMHGGQQYVRMLSVEV